MLRISQMTCDGRETPSYGWKLESDEPNCLQASYHLRVQTGDTVLWDSGPVESGQSVHVLYGGTALPPHALCTAQVRVTDTQGHSAEARTEFYTGKLGEPWQGQWITTGNVNDKENMLPAELFQAAVTPRGALRRAVLCASALGIYEASLNGAPVNGGFFAPGHTDYKSHVQFQCYDVTGLMRPGENRLRFTLANGWYLGTIARKNNHYGKRRGLIAELRLEYADGQAETIVSGPDWQWTADGPVRYADFYNGQVTDMDFADETRWHWRAALPLRAKTPALAAQIGPPVTVWREVPPVRVTPRGESLIVDFGQNMAGVVRLRLRGSGQWVKVRHAELLDDRGLLYTENLRLAKAELQIHALEGEREYMPKFTFMGFRYAEITGIAREDILDIAALALSSEMAEIGAFACSDDRVNRLQRNLVWGQRSNFIDIPTDCPQRNERLGWTGDIAVFSSTAAYNADVSRFLRKWLRDLRAEQRRGRIPFTVPDTHAFFPFAVTTAGWGDAAVMVPWAAYLAYGDLRALEECYGSMQAFFETERRAAARFRFGWRRYLWEWGFQFGDWCAPGESYLQWAAKKRWLSTAYYANSAEIMRQAAKALGKTKDETRYAAIRKSIEQAFLRAYLKDDGTLTGDFQSAYVCALYFGLLPEESRGPAARRLAQLIEKSGGCLATGFLGTPYITFALSDNGHTREAYDLLLNEACPGWLYTVKAGGTTVWERWDALDENGLLRRDIGISNMVSFNHYAYGAVGDWFYRRVCGLEAVQPGYRHFRIAPQPDKRFSFAETSCESPYGPIEIRWELDGPAFRLHCAIPANTTASVLLPDGTEHALGSGTYDFGCEMREVPA